MKPLVNVLLLLVLLTVSGCRESLVQNIDESRAHRVISELYSFGIHATKSKQSEGQWGVEVEAEELTRAIAILTSRKLMPEGTSEEPSQTGLMDSKEDRQFAYQRKLGVSLEKTLETFPSVLRARVHIFLPPTADFLSSINQPPASTSDTPKARNGSASIVLLTDEGAAVTHEQVSAIVAGATGIAQDAVSIVFETVAPIAHHITPSAPVLEHAVPAQVHHLPARELTSLSEEVSTASTPQANGTLLWGTVAYLLGIMTLLSSLALVIIKRQKTVSLGQRILYEQS